MRNVAADARWSDPRTMTDRTSTAVHLSAVAEREVSRNQAADHGDESNKTDDCRTLLAIVRQSWHLRFVASFPRRYRRIRRSGGGGTPWPALNRSSSAPSHTTAARRRHARCGAIDLL